MQIPTPSATRASAVVLLTALAALLCGTPSAALAAAPAAAAPEQTFESLFGAGAKKVLSTPDGADDAAFARKLLDAAPDVAADPAFQAHLFARACEFALAHADGDATAAEALGRFDGLTAELRPGLRAPARQGLLLALERAYGRLTRPDRRKAAGRLYLAELLKAADAEDRAGDVEASAALLQSARPVAKLVDAGQAARVVQRLKDLTGRVEQAQRARELEGRLQKSPDDSATAAELVRVLVVELGRAADAEPYLGVIADPDLKDAAVLAAKRVAALTEAELLRLGQWYKAQGKADAATAYGRRAVLNGARECYQRYLELHTAQDPQRLKAKLALEEIGALMAKGRRVVDLLALVTVKRDAVSGSWKFVSGGIESDGSQFAILRLPYQPPEEYDFAVEFTRRGGSAVTQILSHKGRNLNWVAGVAGHMYGFEMIGGAGADGNATTGSNANLIRDGKRHRFVVHVRRGSLEAYVDGKLIVRRETDYSDVTAHPNWRVSGEALGVGTYHSVTVFHLVQVVEVRGEGRVLAPRR